MPALRRMVPAAAVWRPQSNIAIWRRDLSPCLFSAARHLAAEAEDGLQFWVRRDEPSQQATLQAFAAPGWQPQPMRNAGTGLQLLMADIATLIDWFRRQSRAPRLHVGLAPVRGNACRFYHTDMVGQRLLCSYAGPGTEWLPDDKVNRSALGHGDNAAVLRDPDAVASLQPGWAALLRGERDPAWNGRGVVHRSPPYRPGHERLVLTIDEPGRHLHG